MIRWSRTALLAIALSAGPAQAQVATQDAPGAVLRAVDKFSGKVVDIEMRSGTSVRFGPLSISLTECRFPAGNPAGDAFAGLYVTEDATDLPVFAGWMVASSPGLNPMDHARYDIWVLGCTTQ